MIVNVKTIPKAKKNEIVKLSDNEFRAKVTAAPEKGKANEAVIKLLSDYFRVAKSRIRLLSGKTSRNKKMEII